MKMSDVFRKAAEIAHSRGHGVFGSVIIAVPYSYDVGAYMDVLDTYYMANETFEEKDHRIMFLLFLAEVTNEINQ